MRILFIHQAFPSQFKNLAPQLARDGHDVHSLSARRVEIPGVESHTYSSGPSHRALGAIDELQVQVVRGSMVASMGMSMRALGFIPDIVIAHSGWGEALFVKDVWPTARLVVLPEFYHRAEGQDVGYDPEFPVTAETRRYIRLRNANTLLSMEQADVLWMPTLWQASTLPSAFRSRCEVIHDGIDTELYAPMPNRRLVLRSDLTFTKEDEVITFVNRNLEPYRGYHNFMRALPEVLAARPNAHVLLIGGSGSSYGAPGNHRETYFDEVRHLPGMDRVHFLGSVTEETMRAALQISSLHVYFTYPFVMGWSPLEAMSCGCVVLGSGTHPVKEFITHGENGFLVDMLSPSSIARSIVGLLETPPEDLEVIREQARRSIRRDLDFQSVCYPQQLSRILGV